MAAKVLPPVWQPNQTVKLDARATVTVLAFCKDEDMGLSEALSFIVNDWAALKLAALRAAAPSTAHPAAAGCSAQTLSRTQDAATTLACQEGVKGA